MKVEFTPIKNLQCNKVHFHSVRTGDDESKKSEFLDFYNRMKIREKDLNDFNELVAFMKEIGLIYGAIDSKFKPEGEAERLNQNLEIIEVENDEEGTNDYGLRLYCLRLDENNVVLFNGDRKTVSGDIMKCDNCRPYFLRANDLAEIINDAMDNGDIWIEDTFIIKSREGFTLNLENYGSSRQ